MKKYRVKSLAKMIAIVMVTVVFGVIAVSSITGRGISDASTAWRQYQEGSMRKALLLMKMRDAFGYGGMIHELKNFVLRGDRPRIIRIHRKLRDFSVALIAFKGMAVHEVEYEAIRGLADILTKYSAVVDLAERLTMEAATPDEIDKAVRVDDRSALAAFEILDAQLFAEYRISVAQTDKALRRVTMLSLIGTLGAVLLLGGVIVLLFWFARTQLLLPMGNLNRVMRDLSDGDYTVPVPYLGTKNEIGEVADAVQAFKESVIQIDRLEHERRRLEAEKARKSLSHQRELERQVATRTEELRQSETHVREVVDSMQDGVITIDEAGNIETFNPAAEKLFGYATQEVVGNNIKILMPISYAVKHDRYLADFVEGDSRILCRRGRKVRGLRRNGDEFPMDLSVVEIDLNGRRRFIGVVRDITQQLENAGKAQRLGRILDETPSAVFHINVKTKLYTDANAGALRMTGYTLDELKRLSPMDLRPDLDEKFFDENLEKLKSGKTDMVERETEQKCKDGTIIPINLQMYYSDNGGDPMMFTIIQDISERKAAEKARRDAQLRLETLLNALPDLIMTISEDAIILGVWPADDWETHIDLTDAVGLTTDDMLAPDDAKAFRKQLALALETGKIQVDHYRPTVGGDTRSRERRIIPSGKNEVVVIIRDITEERRKEEKSQRLGRILDESPNAVFIADASTMKFIDANEGAIRMMGYSLDELSNMTAADIRPDVTEDMLHARTKLLKDRDGDAAASETWLKRKNGELFPAEVRRYYSDTMGDPIVFSIIQDISERVTDRKSLELAKEAAEAANRTKSAFLANMSHELRTPLNAIIGYSEMLTEIAQEENQQDSISDLGKIQDAGTHLLALINDILDLSKIEAGKVELESCKFSVPELIHQTASLVRPLIDKNNNRFQVNCRDDVGDMRGDETRVRQVLYNLLSNAAKFTEEGDIVLTVSRETRNGSDWIEFQIRDSGIGMDEGQISQLFQEFSQADASTTRKYGGTGLGLAISRRFCVMMGGDIGVRSKLGEGSTFTVVLQADIGKVAGTVPSAENTPSAKPAMIASYSSSTMTRPRVIF